MNYSTKTKLDEEANKRDNFKCTKCNLIKNLETHHIKPEIEKLDNLITLCIKYHKKEHNYSGCFEQGLEKDKIRKKTQFKSNNIYLQKLRKINKKKYYNRWIKKWIDIK